MWWAVTPGPDDWASARPLTHQGGPSLAGSCSGFSVEAPGSGTALNRPCLTRQARPRPPSPQLQEVCPRRRNREPGTVALKMCESNSLNVALGKPGFLRKRSRQNPREFLSPTILSPTTGSCFLVVVNASDSLCRRHSQRLRGDDLHTWGLTGAGTSPRRRNSGHCVPGKEGPR